ncbi:aminopeptidase N-like isoform X2 [Arctopsyche grandis]|uniref:aminopeptidase N-like isoform X2 n=1 Tax=Arctopsyche grandis TaxID=121162 RepID=UPI00406D8439
MHTIETSSFEPTAFNDFHQRPSIDQPSVCSSHFRSLTTTSTPERTRPKNLSRGDSTMFTINSRQEFLPGEPNGGAMRYKRHGGIFIRKWVAVALVFAVIALVTAVGLLVYYYAPGRSVKTPASDELTWEVKTTTAKNIDEKSMRLPNQVVPSFYRLKIKPNFTNFTFEGKVSITLSTQLSNVKYITLHSRNLEILNGSTLIEQNIVTAPTISIDTILSKVRRATESDGPKPQAVNGVLSLNNSATTINDTSQISNSNLIGTTPKATNSIEILKPNSTGIVQKDEMSIRNEPQVLTQMKNNFIKIIHMEKNPSLDRLSFMLDTSLKSNTSYTLEINFMGKIDNSLNGFYRSAYKDIDNSTKVMGLTHFEPTAARKAFPCFDEPGFKAKFEISIARNKTMNALSNMPLQSEEADEKENIMWSHFERSVPMSTYLVAFVISEFESITANALPNQDNKYQIKIWTRKEMLPQTQYAAEIAPKLLKFYEEYFGLPYSLPKLDLIAIPNFAVGAMENWGLVTFQETSLLLDPNVSSIKLKKNIATVIAHELAHQWFGNLVTMKWWNDLWLNEGFATYMEYIGVNAIEPSWSMLDQFGLDRMNVLGLDSLQSTRPVSAPVNDDSLINQLFDDISYMKAASLLRMLSHILTPELFQDGLVKYMKEWQFKNAKQNDLWKAFSSVAGNTKLPPKVSVANFMDSWTLQAGYPVIDVTRHYENGTATVTQKRFYLYQPPKDDSNTLWHIPISFAVGNTKADSWNTTPNAWLEKTPRTIVLLPDGSNSTWIYFNIKAIGYYRVNYDYKNWKLLEYGLYDAPDEFPPVTRGQLLDDAFSLAQAGQLNYTVALDLTKYMIDTEKKLIPWYATLTNLQLLYMGLQRSSKYGYFQEYISRLVMPALKTFGYEPMSNDTTQETMLREQLVYWACLVEEQECLDWAQNYFTRWVNQTNPDQNNPIPSINRVTVYTTVLRMGGVKEFDFLFERFTNSNDAEVRNEIIVSLSSTRTTWKLYFLFEYSLTEMETDLTALVWSGIDSYISSTVAFSFVIENWDRIYAKYSKIEPQVFLYIIDGAFGNIATDQELFQFKKFIQDNKEDLAIVSMAIQKNLERAMHRINWAKTKMEDIERWLVKFSETKTTSVNEFSTLYGEYGSLKEMSQNFGEYLHTLIDDKKALESSIFMG